MEMEAGLDRDEAAAAAVVAAEGHGEEPAAEEQAPPLPVADGDAVNDHTNHLSDGLLADNNSLIPTEEGARASKKRKSDSLEAAADAEGLPVADGIAVNDHIGRLPDGILGDVISLLSIKDGARTQALSSQWLPLWRTAPLNLDYRGLPQDRNLGAVMERILKAHQGPSRRFCAPVYHLHGDRVATADAWLKSPALRNLQELELRSYQEGVPYPFTSMLPSPVAVFRFSETLCLATIGDCEVPNISAEVIYFPKLMKLQLEHVIISKSSLETLIKGCIALDCLLIANSHGFSRVNINSTSLRSICIKGFYHHGMLPFDELTIEDAPCLERLLQRVTGLRTVVISAPKLETLGYVSSNATVMFGSTEIQGLLADSLTLEVRTVKILDVGMNTLSLDIIINLMRCFPCVERLYIQCGGKGEKNIWHNKHKDFISSFDIRLKRVSWRFYRRIKSYADFAKFFVLNAKALELMTFEVDSDDYNDPEFFAEQHEKLRLDRKASTSARFRFTPHTTHRCIADFDVHDLALADPFGAENPSECHVLF